VSEAARQVSVGSLRSSITLEARDSQDAEIRELTQAFEEMLDRLQEGVARQTSFASSAAHQLRNPLATLRTNLEVVGEDPEATLEDYRRMTPALHRALSRMEKLVTDLLLISTTDKSLNYEPVHIGPLLENAVEDLLPLAREHGVTLCLDSATDAVVHGDERLLQQVIANLVDNAVRYNRKDGEVRLAAEESGETVTIRVQDTGIGIAPEDRERIFERFYRTAHSARLNRAGSGLGLSIVAHLVQLHNGQMSITSGPGGSEFVVVLPATLSEAILEAGPGLGPSVRPPAVGSTPSTARELAPRLDTASYLRGGP
jgi:signal transduction histidine kinase